MRPVQHCESFMQLASLGPQHEPPVHGSHVSLLQV